MGVRFACVNETIKRWNDIAKEAEYLLYEENQFQMNPFIIVLNLC